MNRTKRTRPAPSPATIATAAIVSSLLATDAGAQFSDINPGPVRERISGTAFPGESAGTIEPGDQLGAFFEDQLIGSFSFTGTTGPEFDLVITGDNPDTQEVEGPRVGDPVEIRFFDSSTNFTIPDIRVETAAGERFNLTFQGQAVPSIPGLPIDFTPSRELNVRISEGQGSGGGSGGGSDGGGSDGGGSGPGLDVNGDGEVNREDAATVIRAIAASRVSDRSGAADTVRGRFVTASQLQAADVNQDGVVSSQDVMAVIRGIHLNERPTRENLRPMPPADADPGGGSDDSDGENGA